MRTDFLLKISATLLLASIIACGPNKALISQAEIDNAKNSGNLESLYQKASAVAASSSSDKDVLAVKSKIANMLVTEKTAEVNDVLSAHQNDPASVSRTKLQSSLKSISGMKDWSMPKFQELSGKLNDAITKVNHSISNLVQQSKLEGIVIISELDLLKQSAALAGEGQAETIAYQQKVNHSLTKLLADGNAFLLKKQFNDAKISAETGLTLDPGNVQFESLLSQSEAGQFENDYRYSIENGKPEMAYQALLEVVDKPIFLQIKKSMGNSILVLASYFSGVAKKSYEKGDLASAYINFQRGRNIQENLSIAQQGFIEEKKYLDLVMEQARKNVSNIGKKQSLLRVVNEFDANYPGLQSELNSSTSDIKNRAMTKLSVAEFKEVLTSNPDVATVGRRISSKLEKILFEKLGNEVLIVTALTDKSDLPFAGLGLKIDGEILQASIEHTKNQGKRSQKVQTGVHRVETEDYVGWAKKSRGVAPVRYNETPIIEEVVLIVEHIRKQAVAEVAVRIIEPTTGKILVTESYVKEDEVSGESINEYQKGDFVQPYVRADLPSDIKILDNLAMELADQVGIKLVNYLQNPEDVFYQKYQEAKLQGDNPSAIELLANAITIAESKNKDITAWYDEMKELVL